jgi:hypothetical protein
MNKKILFLAGGSLLLAILAVGALLFWPVPEGPRQETVTPTPTPAPEVETLPRESTPAFSTPTPVIAPTPPVMPLAPWEERLGEILAAPGDTTTAARALLAAMPGLPDEAQEQYIAHALNLCEDSDFSRVEEIYLRSNTPPSVAEAIFNDALNRPDEVKLPLMAKTMGLPNHPMAGEARGILELYLELEPDAPPPQGSWDVAVQDYLKKQQEP